MKATAEENVERLVKALEAIIWKLSHSYSASGKGDDCVPGHITRKDATIVQARKLLDEIKGV